MYVCLCNAVKDSEIAAAVADGHDDIESVAEALGVGTGCGSCQSMAQAIIDAALQAGPERSKLYYAA